MKLTSLRAAAALALAIVSLLSTAPAPAAEPVPPAGFRALFNGKDLTGWHGLNPHSVGKAEGEKKEAILKKMRDEFAQHWRVENGELVNDGTGPYATTDEDLGDIELLIEYKTVPKADSGIYLRGTPQVQIWDKNQKFDPKNPTRRPFLGSGGLFNNAPDARGHDPLGFPADKPFGMWNSFRIRQIGSRTWVWLNDKLVVSCAVMENYWDRTKPLPAKGPIMLQTHGGEIRWRNIFVRDITPKEVEAERERMKSTAEGGTAANKLEELMIAEFDMREEFDAFLWRGDIAILDKARKLDDKIAGLIEENEKTAVSDQDREFLAKIREGEKQVRAELAKVRDLPLPAMRQEVIKLRHESLEGKLMHATGQYLVRKRRGASAIANADSLAAALTLHASFDDKFEADFSKGDKACTTARGKEHVKVEASDELQLVGEGKFGGALKFPKKGTTRPEFKGANVVNYNDKNWSTTVSLWLSISPDEDLEPGYCDPVQIVGNDSKKGYIFCEWSKDETPRFFRYAIRPLYHIWNPTGVQWAEIPFEKRPMVQVAKAPFSRDRWTHVVFTVENLNDKTQKPRGKLYLDGKLQGAIENWDLTFDWDPAQVYLVLGAAYVGRIDDLSVYNRALTDAEVERLFKLPGGAADLRK